MEQLDNDEKLQTGEVANFSFDSEEFKSQIQEALNSDNSSEELETILNSLHISSLSQKNINDFFKFFKRFPLTEDNLEKLLLTLLEVEVQNGILKKTISLALIKLFLKLKKDSILIIILKILLNGLLSDIKTLPVEKLIENLEKKFNDASIKDKEKELCIPLLNLFTENKSKLNYIYFFAKMLKIKSLPEGLRRTIEREFVKYYENEILDDSDMERNLAKQRKLTSSLKYVDENLIYDIIIPRCESLLLRSIRNYKFLEVFFTNVEMALKEDFVKNLLSRFRDFFFNNDNKIIESAVISIKAIAKFSNRRTILESLLNLEFSADKIEQNLNICQYLVILLSHNNEKSVNVFFSKKELLQVVNLVLKRLELVSENNKSKLELILEMLVLSLYQNSITDDGEIGNVFDTINTQIKKLVSASNYSYFFGYLYTLITILCDKFNLFIQKNTGDILFNHIDDVVINPSNMRNVLPLISACFTLTYHKNEYFNNNNKKFLLQALQKLFYDNTSVIFKNNNFLTMTTFDFVNILNIYKQISRNSESCLYSYFGEDELKKLARTISVLLFRKCRNNSEEVFFADVINNHLQSKQVFDFLITNSFVFILNFFSIKENNDLDKVSFHRVQILNEKYADKFYQDFDDKDFLKFFIMAHIPNFYNDMNIETHKAHHNPFLDKLYAKYSNLELNKDIFTQIADNYKPLSQFIFSDLGLFNKHNRIVLNSCYSILTRLSQIIAHPEFSHNIAKDAFINLNLEKLTYIDNLVKYYNKQVEYISFYDLTYLVENLKEMEKKFASAQVSAEFDFNWENKTEVSQSANVSTNVTAKKATKTTTQIKGKSTNIAKSTQQPEKVDKEVKTQEMKNFMERFLINLVNHQAFLMERLSPILFLFNHAENATKVPADSTEFIVSLEKNKAVLSKVLKHLWKLLRVKSINQNLLKVTEKLFKENQIAKNFSYEFSYLMFLQVNPSLFNSVLESHPNLVLNFNEKLEHIMTLPEERTRLFQHFDFIVIKILFFIILNHNISNEDKISSVHILIKIIETLPEEILNFNDISLLAVSLLKTSYNHENLSVLLEIFLTRSKEEHFLILCEDILDYEYVAKVTFLTQILNLNLVSLRKFKNLVYKIWILIFDENDNICVLSKEIWNKFNLYLDSNFVYSNEFLLAFTNHREKDSVNLSIRAYAFLIKSEIKVILDKYEQFYEKEITELENIQHLEETDEGHHRHYEIPLLRTILFDLINETIEVFTNEMKQSLLDFLMRISDREPEEEVFEMMNHSIFVIIKSIGEEKVIINIMSSIEKNIKQISTREPKEINFNNLKIILMMLNSILINTVGNIHVRTQKESLYESLFLLSHKLTNSEVLCLVSSCYQFLAKDNTTKSEGLLTQILDNFKSCKDKLINIGELYILAGLVKCFGINTYKSSRIHEMLLENMKKNKTIQEKQNAVTLIKVFAETLKRLFEPYLVGVFDQICEMIADREDKVRETTTKAIKSFMKEVSGFGVKSIMPRLVKDLHGMNWRSKVVNIEILGQFAFCAPKQLSIYIPVVIKEIMQVFKDPHHKVQETAVMVLKDISSVIKNPEIVELASLLIDAIANPYEHSKNALNALLETDFKHAIDPPSLALIIPIIDYNLKVQSEQLKKMAAHLIGSIANLIMNPLDIYQYIDIIIPNLKIALFDSIPECRNAMAKAIGSLTKNLGVNYLQEMLTWVKTFLEKDADTVQKSGAAQAYAEMLVAYGESFIDKHILYIISKIQESDSIGKEGYLSIFVFLPGCLGDKFEKYFELIFPLIIEGFSDDQENVRNVSNKIFEICIKLFAQRNTKQLVDPLLCRLFDNNWRIRNSSIALIKTLIMNLNKEFFKESSTYFTKELRDEILINTFILKADNSGNTSTIANMIWRDYVDNIPRYISKVLRSIYEQIMVLLSSDNDECFDIAEGIIKMLVTKFSDRFFLELLPMIKETTVERKDNENNVYASFYIYLLAVTESGEKLLSAHKEKFIRIVNENIHTDFSSVRKLLANIMFEISKKFDDHNMNKVFIYNVMKQARGKPFEEQKNLLEIVGNLVDISKGEVLHYVINEIFRKPFEEGFFSLASMIADDIAKNVRDHADLKDLYDNLFDALLHIPKVSVDAIVSITARLEEGLLPVYADLLTKLKDKLETQGLSEKNKDLPYNITQIIFNFVEITSQDLNKINDKFMEIVVSFLVFDNDDLTRSIGDCIKLIAEKAEKEEIDKFLRSFLTKLAEIEDKYDLAGVNKFDKINSKFKLMMDNLLYIVQNGLLYADDKLLACDFVQKVIDYTSRPTMKTYIMKMIGPMIRILSEKFSPQIKERVLDNIKELIVKSREDVKGISPQLQSVFVKTLTDTSQVNCERAQLKAGENILRLLQFYPRGDVIVNDIMKSIISKFERNEVMMTMVEIEILSDIIRFYGHTLKPNVLDDHYAKIQNLINSRTDTPYDYLAILLSSFTKHYADPTKVIEQTAIKEELPRKLFNFITIFNGNSAYFAQNKKNAIKIIKSLPKDQVVILLKSLGKVINKYRFFIDFDRTNIESLLTEYEKVTENIIMETDLLVPSNNILDANLCVFILSLGYMKNYEHEELFDKVFSFILGLIQQAKVNSQLLVNCLSLLVEKEIKQNPDRDTIIFNLEHMNVDENDVEAIDSFLKKIYYLYS